MYLGFSQLSLPQPGYTGYIHQALITGFGPNPPTYQQPTFLNLQFHTHWLSIPGLLPRFPPLPLLPRTLAATHSILSDTSTSLTRFLKTTTSS